MFFKDNAQIQNLIKMQREHFKKSITMELIELKDSYVKLGEYHYDIKIPYVDFIKGVQIIEEYFLLHTTKNTLSREIMDDIFLYFRYVKSFAAKGYLNRMIQEDKKDIENFFSYSEEKENTYIFSVVAVDKINWLKNLLDTIEIGGTIDFKLTQTLLDKWLDELSSLSAEKRQFINDLEKRIMINTQNLFYFLHKEDYLEMLPLYSSLLGIYKLTLLLNNVLTVEHANHVIKNLKIDSLSHLYRKDSFVEFLEKEISYEKREKEYKFSVAYLDMDDFKHINDDFGHYSGDKVIEKFGDMIQKNIRSSDIGFRIGGDEFAIIFKNTTKENAKKVCQKIKSEFTSYDFIFNEKKVFKVGVSIGILECNEDTRYDKDSFIKMVDDKLYDAKHAGKNQIAY